MYVVREKKSNKIIHKNPAPLKQKLKGKAVYFKFDDKTMVIGEIEGCLPEHFNITKKGEIVELSLKEKVKAGFIKLETHQKIKKGEIVEKTLTEKVAEGLLKLTPEQKLVNEEIVEKSQQEMLDENMITLHNIKKQKIDEFSSLALSLRRAILPDHKIQNALLGIYEDQVTAVYKKTIEEFRKEYHQLKTKIEEVETLHELNKIEATFPESLSESSSKN